MYSIGLGTDQDDGEAVRWFRRAALQEMARLCARSACKSCEEGSDVARDPRSRPNQHTAPASTQRTEKSSGTGFFVSGMGHMVTNRHVVEGCGVLSAVIANASIPIRVVGLAESDDLAVLKAETKPKAIALFRDSAKIVQGETVVTYGYPLSGLLASSGNVSTGLVTALAGSRDDPRQLRIRHPSNQGIAADRWLTRRAP